MTHADIALTLTGIEDAIGRALFAGAMVPVVFLVIAALVLFAWNRGWI